MRYLAVLMLVAGIIGSTQHATACPPPTYPALTKHVFDGQNHWLIHGGNLYRIDAEGKPILWWSYPRYYWYGVGHTSEYERFGDCDSISRNSLVTHVRYTSANSSIPQGAIGDVLVDDRGRLWVVSTYGAVSVFDNNEWRAVVQFNNSEWSNTASEYFLGAQVHDGSIRLLYDGCVKRLDVSTEKLTKEVRFPNDFSPGRFLDDGSIDGWIVRSQGSKAGEVAAVYNIKTRKIDTLSTVESVQRAERGAEPECAMVVGQHYCRARVESGILDITVDRNGYVYLATTGGVTVFKRNSSEDELFTPRSLHAIAPYPNPANTYVTFGIDDDGVKSASVTIIDKVGRLRLEQAADDPRRFTVDVQNLETGTYMAILKSEDVVETRTIQIVR